MSLHTVAVPGAPGRAGTLGVVGGGQLGRMFVHAAQVQGYRVVVLDPDAASPAGAAADAQVAAPYDDPTALDTLAATCVAVTTEFENVPAQALQRLASTTVVSPPAHAVQVCQHRSREKALFASAGVPCAPHLLLMTADDVAAAVAAAAHEAVDAAATAPLTDPLAQVAALLPGILKTASLGYDGKGQCTVLQLADLPAAFAQLGGVPCVLEKRLPLQREISVIVARAANGQTVHLPVQQNLHVGGILAVTQVPAPDVSPALCQQAVQLALQLAHVLQYVGVLCVEFFVLADGSLVANEMAPRPHNSGHYSVDACDQSQFDLQVRCLAGLPLVQPRQHSAAVMLNLLGDLWLQGDAAPGAATPPSPTAPPWPALLALPGVRVHLYGKQEPRRGRKMGHLTVTAPSALHARGVALQAAQLLGLPAF
jgi:5-(carboxyamino)imidazole ribonucleotide synthase